MSIKRITSKKPYVLENDDSGHYYLIPYDLKEDFDEWLSIGYENWEGIDYEQFRINGPHTLKIYSWADDT